MTMKKTKQSSFLCCLLTKKKRKKKKKQKRKTQRDANASAWYRQIRKKDKHSPVNKVNQRACRGRKRKPKKIVRRRTLSQNSFPAGEKHFPKRSSLTKACMKRPNILCVAVDELMPLSFFCRYVSSALPPIFNTVRTLSPPPSFPAY